MTEIILTINAGSSSIKFAAFELGQDELGLLASGHIDGIGSAASFSAQIIGGAKTEFHIKEVFVLPTDEERTIAEHAAEAAGLIGVKSRLRETKEIASAI